MLASKTVQPWPKHVKPKARIGCTILNSEALMNTIQNRCCPFGAALFVNGVFAPNQRAEVTKARNQKNGETTFKARKTTEIIFFAPAFAAKPRVACHAQAERL